MEKITQWLTLILLVVMFFFQGRNYYRYGKDNDGANLMRITFMLTLACFATHTVRLMLNYTHGYFFSLGVLCVLVLFIKIYNS